MAQKKLKQELTILCSNPCSLLFNISEMTNFKKCFYLQIGCFVSKQKSYAGA